MRRAFTFALACCTAGAALAADPAGGTAGDILAAGCAGCHRSEPTDPGGIPSLDGLSADEIAEKLTAYRRGELRGTLMNRLARGYTEAEIRMLAQALAAPTE